MARKIAISLLRNDLRVHDNAMLHFPHTQACKDVTHVMPLYVFDERYTELSGLPGYQRQGAPAKTRVCGFWRTGVFRAKFILEGVYDLRHRLRTMYGSDLFIGFGQIEQVAEELVKAFQAKGDSVAGIYLQKEFCTEEQVQQRNLNRAMKTLKVPVKYFETTALLDPKDLPFSIEDTPDVFTPFRKRIEATGKFGRPPLQMPERFKPFPEVPEDADVYTLPASISEKPLQVLQHLLDPIAKDEAFPHLQQQAREATKNQQVVDKSAFPYPGGETAALTRLSWYFKEGDPPQVASYKKTRNELLGHAYSTKMSPFLCLGCVSPRLIIQALDEHEDLWGSNQNTYWVRFEMLWREYMLYIARKYGSKLFTLGGFEEETDPKQAQYKMQPGWWKPFDASEPDDGPQKRWMGGRTGVPFIDANMTELRQSGFMSNRGRQNVASFLTKDLQIDWRVGAEFFESHLIDYEPCANYGNWQYVAGCGNDPRASRQFNPIKQANDYDPQGAFIKHWLPELQDVPPSKIQAPWLLSREDRRKFNVGDYPDNPVIEQPQWKQHYHKRAPGKQGGPNPNEKARTGPKTGKAPSAPPHQTSKTKRMA